MMTYTDTFSLLILEISWSLYSYVVFRVVFLQDEDDDGVRQDDDRKRRHRDDSDDSVQQAQQEAGSSAKRTRVDEYFVKKAATATVTETAVDGAGACCNSFIKVLYTVVQICENQIQIL